MAAASTPARVAFGVIAILVLLAVLGISTVAGRQSDRKLRPTPTPAATPAATPVATPAATPERSTRFVDEVIPAFSNPTEITNPLFPISELAQVIQLGDEAGEPLRIEVTLLPETRFIDWQGEPVETVISQYVAYVDGRILEVAYDYYAQGDDGSVWYFGEDVFNYEDGVIVDTDGTWLAGIDGPPGMIMPADPQGGDMYRPENAPGVVYEEVTVQAVDVTVDGPRGPVSGAIQVQEVLMDGTVEEKFFAPGYGEFLAQASDELVTVAIAVPIDALGVASPAALGELRAAAESAFDAAREEDWAALRMSSRAGVEALAALDPAAIPPLVRDELSEALVDLTQSARNRDGAEAQQSAIELAMAALDLEMRYQSVPEVDLGRLRAWTWQLALDAAEGNLAAVLGDTATIETILDRLLM